MAKDPETRAYPRSLEPDALWNFDEIMGYLSISTSTFYEIEPHLRTFKVGKRKVAFARDVIAYARHCQAEQNPVPITA